MKIKHADSILIRNNISAIWADKKALFQIIFVPLLISVIIPILLTFSTLIFETGEQVDSLKALLPDSLTSYNNEQTIHYISTNFICVMLFPLIPITVSSAACSSCLIGEKENRTILALLTSPISASLAVRMKYISSALLSTVISFISAFCFFITASIGNIVFGTSFFFDLVWAINIFLLPPAISLFCPLVITLCSSHLKSKVEALQISSYLTLAFLVFHLLEFTGIYKITYLTLLILAVILYISDLIMLFLSENFFKPESFILVKEEQ